MAMNNPVNGPRRLRVTNRLADRRVEADALHATNLDVPGSQVAQNFTGALRTLAGDAVVPELPLLFLVPP